MGNGKMTFNERLMAVQDELVAPKSQWNSHGGFKYRNCEDILLAVKPLLMKYGFRLKLSDDIVAIESRLHVKVTATILDKTDSDSDSVTAFAEIPHFGGTGGVSQATGAASSYARKYALGGLLLVDDSRDEDSMRFEYNTPKKKKESANHLKNKESFNISHAIKSIGFAKTDKELRAIFQESWKGTECEKQKEIIKSAYDTRKKEILGFVLGETPDKFRKVLEDSEGKSSKADRIASQVKSARA